MNEPVDICMLVEGTYPYIAGGVSSWIHSLITNLPEFTFSIVHIGTLPDEERVRRYELPANVIAVHELFLQDIPSIDRHRHSHSHPTSWDAIYSFHAALAQGKSSAVAETFDTIARLPHTGLTTRDLLFSYECWDLIGELYRAHAPDSPFRDFFWTFRATHLPLFRLIEASVPAARLFHAPSAGFAGLLGAITKTRCGAPFLLTEHGVYMHEREIEIAQAEWIPTHEQLSYRLDQQPGVFREWWTAMFRFMTRTAYDFADEIISVTTANQRYQIQDGADPRRMKVIPNGVDLRRFGNVRTSLTRQSREFTVGFVGRVVPIKDVKAFIRAIRIASGVIPGLRAFIVGPTDEDPDYYAECHRLTTMLGLDAVIRFTGRADAREYYRFIDVLVLTSISEAAPLVILEANCAGVPVIATDVGACRAMLFGETPTDQALGSSGLITTVSSPQETAAALIALSTDEERRQQLARTGQQRTRQFYDIDQIHTTYRHLYQHYLSCSITPLVGD
jgi:glycosyltransferase involved in cell wall biosynthesis